MKADGEGQLLVGGGRGARLRLQTSCHGVVQCAVCPHTLVPRPVAEDDERGGERPPREKRQTDELGENRKPQGDIEGVPAGTGGRGGTEAGTGRHIHPPETAESVQLIRILFKAQRGSPS